MASPQQTIRELVSAINKSVEGFNTAIPGLQKQIASEIELLVKDLEITNGRIAPSAKNLRIIGNIKAKIERVILSPEYKENLKQYSTSFNEITKIQNRYFGQLTSKFKPTSVLKELQRQSIGSTMESLSRAGISANVAKPVQDILRTNITSGAKYTDLAQQLRDFITTNDTGSGRLERYVKQITTDALNQYSRNYTKVVTDDLGLEWYMYTGAELETSRPFCQAMLDKKYFHKSEVPELLDGDFPEFKKNDGKLNKKTGLPEGMIAGTNTENFYTYAGGYNCGHQIVPVDESAVPEVIKSRFKNFMKVPVNNGSILQSKQAHQKDLKGNLKVAKVLAESFGDNVEINPHIEGQKNPELKINGKIADRKTPNPQQFKNIWRPISEGMQRATKQKATHAVIELSKNYDREGLIEGVRHGFKNSKIEIVDFVFSGKKAIRITREDYEDGVYIQKIEEAL